MTKIQIYPWATDTIGLYWRLKLPLDALESVYPDEFEVCWSCEPKPGENGVRSVVVGQRITGNGAEPDARWQAYCDDPGIMAVYELDDDLIDLDPGNTVPYNLYTPNRLGTAHNIQMADHLIVSTPNLAYKLHDYIRDDLIDRTTVGLNCIADGSVFERTGEHSPAARATAGRKLTVGWAGSAFHGQDFPQSLIDQLAAVRDANPDVVWVSLGTNYLGWGSVYGFTDIPRYHERLKELDIGIAPLSRTPFNQSKSWIKALDYLHRGVIPVVEDWGQYPDLIGDEVDWTFSAPDDLSVGRRVYTPDSWAEVLNKAIDDARRTDLARTFDHEAIAARAREFEISNHVGAWADVFRRAAA